MTFGGPPEMYAKPPEQDVWRRRVEELQSEIWSARRAVLSRKLDHWWRVRHVNGNIVASSGEGYANRADRDDMLNFLWPDLPEPIDLDKAEEVR